MGLLKTAYERIAIQRFSEMKKYKKRYDMNQKHIRFNEGDFVIFYWPLTKNGLSKKLLPTLKGPYKIVKRLRKLTYRIEKDDKGL